MHQHIDCISKRFSIFMEIARMMITLEQLHRIFFRFIFLDFQYVDVVAAAANRKVSNGNFIIQVEKKERE